MRGIHRDCLCCEGFKDAYRQAGAGGGVAADERHQTLTQPLATETTPGMDATDAMRVVSPCDALEGPTTAAGLAGPGRARLQVMQGHRDCGGRSCARKHQARGCCPGTCQRRHVPRCSLWCWGGCLPCGPDYILLSCAIPSLLADPCSCL